MRKSKLRIFALFLAVSLLFTSVPVAAATAENGQERAVSQSEIEVGVEVTYNQTEARQMLQRINEFRTGGDAWAWNEANTEKVKYTDLGELVYDYELEKVAMQRAAELVAAYSHTRPDGTLFNTAYGSEFTGAKGENLAIGLSGATEEDVYRMWREDDENYSGQGHRRNMLGQGYKAVGIARIEYNGYTYWVQEFSGSVVDTKETEPEDGLVNVKMTIANDRISERKLEPVKSSVSIKVGESAPAPQAHIVLRTKETGQGTPSLQVSEVVQASWDVPVSETLVALSADGSLKALAVGKTTVKIVYEGIEGNVSVVITETAPPQADADKTTYLTIDGGTQGMYNASRRLTVAVFGRASCSNTKATLKNLDDLGLPDDQVDICYIDIMGDTQENVEIFAARMATAGVTYCYDLGYTANNALWSYAQEYLNASVSQPANLPVCVYTDDSGNVLKVTQNTQKETNLKSLLKSIGCEDLLPDNSAKPTIKGLTVTFRDDMHYVAGRYWPFNVSGTQTGDTVEYALAGDNPVYSDIMKKLVHAGDYQIICRVSREGCQTWIRTIKVKVAQIDPEYEIPKNLQGKSGTTLADVVLPKGFSWKSPKTSLKKPGTYSYPAVFTPENARDYRTVDVTIEVKVACPGHKYTSTVIKQPTKTSTGTKRFVCDYCEYTYTEKIDKLPASQGNNNNNNNNSNNNNKKKVTPPAKVKFKSVKRSGGTKVKLSWKKVSGASGYELYMKTGKGKYKKIKTLGKTKTSYTKTKLKKKTSYTFRIRAYKLSGKKKVYGAYSVAKKVK